MFRRRLASGVVAAALLLLSAVGAATEPEAESRKAALLALTQQEPVRLFGLERLDDGPAPPVVPGAEWRQRLDQLLAGYNYVLTADAPGGQGLTVRILGPRAAEPRAPAAAPAPTPVSVATVRRGRHHLVPTTIVGPNGASAELQLLLDTGASTVVLPASLAAPLGFAAEGLRDDVAHTAAGTVPVRLGTLRAVRVGGAHVANVAVAFVDDAMLGNGSLLGMSFLEHFDLRLEDGFARLTLRRR
jgi:aspartyl protease family protein